MDQLQSPNEYYEHVHVSFTIFTISYTHLHTENFKTPAGSKDLVNLMLC